MHRPTHVIIAEFFRDSRGVAEKFARPFGVNSKVPSSWGRPKASDENPHGTGQGNPLDQGERLISLVHTYDSPRAREMAENFVALVDRLDRDAGAEAIAATESPMALLAKSICEHSDVAAAVLEGGHNLADLMTAKREIREAKTALLQLEGAIDALTANAEAQAAEHAS